MKSRSLILLKNLLRSTSGINVLRYEKDSKKKNRVIGGYAGVFVLYAMLMAYCILTVIGYKQIGIAEASVVMCGVLISVTTFIFTFLKTNGYLFAFKDYDMLMALPFKPSEVAGTKFLYMYFKNLPWVISISLSMMIGYMITVKATFYVFMMWIILSLLLPVIPMIIASAIGALIAAAGSKFRHKQLIQIILTFAVIFLAFASRFIIESIFKENKVADVLTQMSATTGLISKYVVTVSWFNKAISETDILAALLLAVSSVLLFILVFSIVGRSYRKINSSLMAGTSKKNFKMTSQKKMSLINTIAYKEFKRFTGSTLYITNMGTGEVLTLIATIALLFVDPDVIIEGLTNGAPLTKAMLMPSIPFIIYFLVGMMPTTAASVSLEGKNWWIIKSLPINMKDVILGKVAFNMYLSLPFMVIATIVMSIRFRVGMISTILFLILGIALCGFSSLLGMVMNLAHPSFEWENEIDVIKKGASVGLYMLINMTLTCILVVAVVPLAGLIGSVNISCIMILFFALLDFICYKLIVNKKL
ncbi:MAG: hypothetical protein MJ123_05340 [Lachnospiraceae bacterium]|nr:hypothetical protein [Lachnospiraceae bacterium]